MKRSDKDNVALAKAETELYHAREVSLRAVGWSSIVTDPISKEPHVARGIYYQ